MPEPRARVLVVLPDAQGARALAEFLGARGFEALSVGDTQSALNEIGRASCRERV